MTHVHTPPPAPQKNYKKQPKTPTKTKGKGSCCKSSSLAVFRLQKCRPRCQLLVVQYTGVVCGHGCASVSRSTSDACGLLASLGWLHKHQWLLSESRCKGLCRVSVCSKALTWSCNIPSYPVLSCWPFFLVFHVTDSPSKHKATG